MSSSSTSSPDATIPWTKIRALTFDVYSTLVDEHGGLYASLAASPLEPYLPGTADATVTAFQAHEQRLHKSNPDLAQSDILAQAFEAYAQQDLNLVPGKLSLQAVQEAGQTVGEAMGTYPPFPDTVAAMQRLGRHYKLAPLSNVDRATFAKTCQGPLAGVLWSAKYLAQDIGSYKPDPANFEYLFEHVKEDFGAEKEQLVHVAQSLRADHVPLRGKGVKSVWVDRGNKPDFDFGDSREGPRREGREGDEKYGYTLRVRTLGELAEIVDAAFEKEEETHI